MNNKLIKLFTLFLILGYTALVVYVVNKDYSLFVDASLGVMLVYVWIKGVRVLIEV